MTGNYAADMKDITEREDIELLVDEFYKKVLKDEVIGHFFTKVVPINWENHIPTMYDFWSATLLGQQGYQGNPMHKHIDLHQKSTLTSAHFDQWLKLWKETVQEYFSGPKANEAVERAGHIAKLMHFNVTQSKA
jgi:hemoglobin